jgi:GTP-binding protein
MTERPIIALVGRPNVGKSTIFNRLIGRRQAITSIHPGTTRDRHFGVMQWYQHAWTVVDTAGVLLGEEEDNLEQRDLQQAMEDQVAVAIAEATIIALVVDVKQGLHPLEQKLIDILRKHNKPLVVLANKADNQSLRTEALNFAALGVDHIFPVSGVHGSGFGDFIEFLIQAVPTEKTERSNRLPRVTFIGRPNVGKSTLTNQMLGSERMIVSDIPGTTRDTVASEVTFPSGTRFELADTAGIRRRGKIEPGIERFSLFRTLKSINYSDIVVQLLSIEEAPTRADAHITMYAQEANKEVILVLNKADLAADNIFKLKPNEQRSLGEKFLKRFPFMQRLPYYFVSAQTGEGVPDLMSALELRVKHVRPTAPVPTEPESTSEYE